MYIACSITGGRELELVYQAGRKVSKMISGKPDAMLTLTIYQSPEDALIQKRDYLRAD